MIPHRVQYAKFLEDGSIRLLRFVNGGGQDAPPPAKLHLELLHYSNVTQAPPFKALSYTWQRPEGHYQDGQDEDYQESHMRPVVINGEDHDVYPNLLDALEELRRQGPDDLFWVDALCINQENLREKEIHVAKMDQIYLNASKVVIWLGTANAWSERIFAILPCVASWATGMANRSPNHIDPVALLRDQFGSHDDPARFWFEYLRLYERRWFNRGWVIQEVALAHDKAVALWGPHTVDWRDLALGAKMFQSDRVWRTYFMPLLEEHLGPLRDRPNLAHGRNALRINLMVNACLGIGDPHSLIVEFATGTRELVSSAHLLLHLMRMSRDFEWKDPRDRVYSLLGLVRHTAAQKRLPGLDDGLRPDYGSASTRATVLTAAATSIIENSNRVGIIMQVSDLSFRTPDGLPSWVPDFVKSPNYAMGTICPFQAWRSSAPDAPPRCRDRDYDVDGATLYVQGLHLGTIRASVVAQDTEQLGQLGRLISALQMAAEATSPAESDPLDVLWRTMVWDIFVQRDLTDTTPAPSHVGDSFVHWVIVQLNRQRSHLDWSADSACSQLLATLERVEGKALSKPLDKPRTTARIRDALSRLRDGDSADEGPANFTSQAGDPGVYVSSASGVIWAQQLFMMDYGHIGMGPVSGAPGDEVWIIRGCAFPMVLRPNTPEGSYCVMGRAYVHERMNGEAVPDMPDWKRLCLK